MTEIKLICPTPPDNFEYSPIITILTKGVSMFRVHHEKYAATAFNPGLGQAGRFSPISDFDGNKIPTLYAGSSINSALAESVFRNIVSTSPAITRISLRDQMLTRITSTRDLNLVDLTQNGLRRLGLKRNQLLESEQENYSQTARWAEALHDFGDKIDGMVWISTQFDTERSMVLFGDRVMPKDLLIPGEGESLYDNSGLDKVMDFANSADITIFL